MAKVGEFVIVNDPNRDLIDEEMVVTRTSDDLLESYKDFLGKDVIVAEDKNGITYTLTPGQYKEKFNSVKEFKRIVFDNVYDGLEDTQELILIKPKQRDKGTRRLFYPVIEYHKDGYSFIDDNEKKRTYPKSSVEVINESDQMNLVIELQEQIHELRQLVVQCLELTADDIQRKLDEFES